MKKFVTYITFYKGNKLPPWYIGSTYEEKINKGYNGTVTSKDFKDIYKLEQKQNKHLFKTKILSYHETREEAYIEELRLQLKHKVVNNPKYFNKSYANKNFGKNQEKENNSMFGRNHSTETKKLISKKNKDNSKQRIKKQKETILNRSPEKQKIINEKISKVKLSRTIEQKEKTKEKFIKSISEIQENGKTKAENMSIKSCNTKYAIQENGKTIHENSAIKAAKTKRENMSMNGLNHPKCKQVRIFDSEGEIKFISDKSFKLFCLENNLPFSIFNKSKQLNKKIEKVKKTEFKKYIGWKAEYIK